MCISFPNFSGKKCPLKKKWNFLQELKREEKQSPPEERD